MYSIQKFSDFVTLKNVILPEIAETRNTILQFASRESLSKYN